jgi:hypothetical protein
MTKLIINFKKKNTRKKHLCDAPRVRQDSPATHNVPEAALLTDHCDASPTGAEMLLEQNILSP